MKVKNVFTSHKKGKNRELVCIGFLVENTFQFECYPVFQFMHIDYETGFIETCCQRYEEDNLISPDYFYDKFFDVEKTGSLAVPEWVEKYFKILEDLFEAVHRQVTQIPF